MIERWSRDQVLSLAPDAASQKAAAGVSAPGKWSGSGALPDVVWGECKGSGATPYRACVDLSEPAYKCSCPSRKFPCKHALGLLLLWASDGVPDGGEPAGWVAEWLEQRRSRAEKQEKRDRQEPSERAKAARSSGGSAQRETRVTAGLSELERWLTDQIAQGIAGARQTGLADWDELGRRLVDAQAPGVAGSVSRLSRVLREEDWPGLLLGEYALIHLLAVAHRRTAELPAGLAETVRSRVGFPITREDVLATPWVRDEWDVIGGRDEEQDRLVARRIWLQGRATGRVALVLSFAPIGQALDASLVTGTAVDASLAYYPGASPLRAVVAERHGPAASGRPAGTELSQVPGRIAGVLTGDPWADSWPVVLEGVIPATGSLADEEGNGLPLHPEGGVPWRLLAVSGGRPVTVAAEWTPRGSRPLTVWDEEGQVVRL
ncbi:SWIM zinc finger family protein [Planotetraspora kaengkrachanensis]|uniref:SWIM zinc finger family protein n=1 Tax=Planotetraspora kaengkrachanensis TaxID=575193 RepID=UPI001945A546|nr:SWIM zinc finger family protein [Planotetraspora kaengkrachanensis]